MTFRKQLDDCEGDTTFFRAVAVGLTGSIMMAVVAFIAMKEDAIEKTEASSTKRKTKKKE